MYDHGSTLTTGRALQDLRGYYAHWGTANPNCESHARPVDVLLGYLDNEEIGAQGASTDIRVAFWNTADWLRVHMEWDDVWNNLFRGSLARRLTLLERFSGPNAAYPVAWLSEDSTLTRIGSVNWRTKEFLRLHVGGLLEPFATNSAWGVNI